jgi:DNA polymerase III subunit epsilon
MEFLVFVIVVVVGFLFYASYNKNQRQKAALSILPEQFVVADIETTGLDAFRHEIIEIAAVRVNRDSKHHDYWTALVRPSKKVPRKIVDITGITQDMIEKDGLQLEKAIEEFLSFVGDHRLVFFNAEFDMAFLDRAALKIGRQLPNKVSCALKMMRRAYPNLKSYRLKDLANVGKLDAEGAHRALKDCELTITVYSVAAAKLGRIE